MPDEDCERVVHLVPVIGLPVLLAAPLGVVRLLFLPLPLRLPEHIPPKKHIEDFFRVYFRTPLSRALLLRIIGVVSRVTTRHVVNSPLLFVSETGISSTHFLKRVRGFWGMVLIRMEL